MNALLENTSSGSQYTALLGKCQARDVTAKRVRRTLKVRWVNLFKQKGSWLIFGDFTTWGIFYLTLHQASVAGREANNGTIHYINPYAAQLSKDHKNASLESDFPGRDSKTPFKLRIKSILRPLNRNTVLTLHYLPLEKC